MPLKELVRKVDLALVAFADLNNKSSIAEKKITDIMKLYVELNNKIPEIKKDDGIRQNDRVGFVDEEKAKNFLAFSRGALTKEMPNFSEKGLTTVSDPQGGFLVPTQFRATLIRLIETYGIVRRGCTVIPMTSSEIDIPTLASGVSVFWVDECEPISDGSPNFGQLKLIAKKLAALVPMCWEVTEDSSIPLANLLATLFAEAVAMEEDRIGLTGNTAAGDPFMGILYHPQVNNVIMTGGSFSSITADDLSIMTSNVKSSATNGAGFYMHRTIFEIVRKIKDSTGNYIVQAPTAATPTMLWGYPVVMSDVMPNIAQTAADTPFVAFGSLRHLYLGDRNQLSIAQSPHYKFANAEITLRMLERIAIGVGVPTAYSVLRTP